MKASDSTSSVDKALALLEFLAAAGKPVTLQDITEGVKLAKPTAYRLLRVLQELGYVSRPTDSRRYLIGPRAARLAAADPYSEIKAQARPLIRRLYEEFNETVNLGVLSGNQVLYLDFLETTQPLRFIVTPGQSDPFYCTALGRAAAAQLPEQQANTLIEGTRLQALTPRTVTDPEELRGRLRTCRTKGWAEELEESVSGVCCLAVSLAPLGFPEAAISIAIPAQRLTPARKDKILSALRLLTQPIN